MTRAQQFTRRQLEECLNRYLDFVVSLAGLDFSKRLEVEGNDIFDAMASGLNMLSEEIRHAMVDLRESEKRFEILSSATSETIVISENGMIVDVNDNFSRLFGYSESEAKGKNVAADIVAPESAELVKQMISSKSEKIYEAMVIRKDQTMAPVEVHGKEMPYRGRMVRIAAIRDLSERKQAEEQLRISDRMASIGQLAASVAHEINNPLSYIIANLDLISETVHVLAESDAANEHCREIAEMLDETRAGAESVRVIASDLRSFSRSSRDVKLEAVDLKPVLDTSIRMASVAIKSRAEIVKCYAETPLVQAARGRLAQVFLNLLVNAAQAMPADRRRDQNQIEITTSLDSSGLVAIRIKDNGSGMSPLAMKRLFTPFFTTKPIGVGTGLGLSICKDIVESFGGRIEVESKAGQGTTFQILLNPEKNLSVLNNIVHPVSGHGETIKGRILILDDDETLAKAISSSLKSDHEVVVVHSGRVALEKLNTNLSFDLILCDIELADMSGIDVYEKIKETFPGTENRFIFLTGGAFTQQAQEFLDSVTNPVLQKPFRPQELRDAVRIQLQMLKSGAL